MRVWLDCGWGLSRFCFITEYLHEQYYAALANIVKLLAVTIFFFNSPLFILTLQLKYTISDLPLAYQLHTSI